MVVLQALPVRAALCVLQCASFCGVLWCSRATLLKMEEEWIQKTCDQIAAFKPDLVITGTHCRALPATTAAAAAAAASAVVCACWHVAAKRAAPTYNVTLTAAAAAVLAEKA